MNDNDIVKALMCCKDAECLNCPRWTDEWYSGQCNDFLQDVLDLINRQKEEIERLKKGWRADVVETENAKSEAIREFAELLKKNAQKFTEYDEGGWGCTVYAVKVEDIDNTVEEMTEGK